MDNDSRSELILVEDPPVWKLLRMWPIQSVRAGSALVGLLTFLGLLVGKVAGRVVIAPDVGIAVLIMAATFYLMARFSRR